MTLFSYTLICLAVWRIAYMLVEEDGPYDIFKRLRADFPKGISPLECFYCTSVWVAIIFGVSLQLSIVVIISLSAMAIFIKLIHDRLF